MKKFLKFYLPLLIFFGAAGIFLLGYMIENHAAVLKYFAGEVGLEGKGKIISTKINAVVKEDGVEQSRAEVFEDDGKLYLVFAKTEDSNFGVLILDTLRKDVLLPNVSDCYDLVFSKYLFQAECGRGGVPYSSDKADMYNVRLEATDTQINFRLPEYGYGKIIKNRQMEIIFNEVNK